MRLHKTAAFLLAIGLLCSCGDDGEKQRTRHYVFRAIGGASMGAMTAAQLGLRHHEYFDIISPSGGGMDLPMLIRWFTERMLGGFCVPPEIGKMCRNPEFNQDFEAMDCGGPAGGGFDREAMFENFQDMFIAYGNLASFNPSHHYLPFGVPPERLEMSEQEWCDNPLRLEGVYDWEFNPEGKHTVITFCEIEDEDEQCVFDPGKTPTYPVEIVLAVDINGDGKRDSGEPVLFRLSERYDDFGEDGVPSSQEPGYDPVSNPDPAGDDYHRLDNARGTEDNHSYDEGEPYLDFGLDGVLGTADSPYDWGEGNGHFDYNPHVLRTAVMYDPSRLLEEMSEQELDRLDFYIDVGIRDHLGFCPSSEAFVGLLNARGRNVDIRDRFVSIMKEGYDVYDVHHIDWKNIGRDLFIRYGTPDATQSQKDAGDGGHVGSYDQVLYRFFTMMNYVSERWPGGEYDLDQPFTRARVLDENMYSEIQGKDQQYYILLPPGYDENPDRRYPVLYLVHGIGMSASDLTATILFAGPWMEEGLIQQFLVVFPDARCQEDCFSGTFMANQLGRHQEGYRYEDSFFQELIPYIDANYRTRLPEEH
ncbi:alpha/beta hydrolase-fold protein [Myxococcota bacterium]